MSKKSQRAQKAAVRPAADVKPARQHRQNAAPDRATLPNWPLLALSLIGVIIAGYLSYTGWMGSSAAFCEEGAGCDIVQSSQWAKFLGAPTAFWGLLVYAALAYVAVREERASVQWRRAWMLAIVGWGVSAYLTAISVFVLQATCIYCLASFAILTAIVALLVWRRPETLPRFVWPRWLLQTGAAALIVIAIMHGQTRSAAISAEEDPYLAGLAMRLAESGAVFYGASWCPHCQQQKAMFGASVDRLPYVECSPGGRNAPAAPSCIGARVSVYPTWVFANGDRVSEVLSTEELARRVGYKAAGSK
ncbi:MAG TPA: vitamin K epoxide reductase family protein [Vicinamibacterales bacterium]|nr:vitamin K epoxide reductase family protein [Vicinamibacterales bacterium]